jgi:hypothetical protein
MKKWMIGILLMNAVLLTSRVAGQAQEVQQLLLDVEKLSQLKSILEDMKKGYEIVSQGYTTIKNLSKGNFNLHAVFLDGLLKVSPVVRNYRRIPDIVQAQIRLVREYKSAYRRFASSGWFSQEELSYMKSVFENLLIQSFKNIEALTQVITAGALRMSDDERLTAIDNIWKVASDQLIFLRRFDQDNKLLALQRAKAAADIRTQKKSFSVNN